MGCSIIGCSTIGCSTMGCSTMLQHQGAGYGERHLEDVEHRNRLLAECMEPLLDCLDVVVGAARGLGTLEQPGGHYLLGGIEPEHPGPRADGRLEHLHLGQRAALGQCSGAVQWRSTKVQYKGEVLECSARLQC